MNRLLAALCAATLLTGSLTACSGVPNDTNANTNSGNGSASPAGTSYSAPGGVNEDRGVSNRRTSSSRARNGVQNSTRSNGRYTAYSDGSLAADRAGREKAQGNSIGNDLARGARDIANGVGGAIRDMTGQGNNANGNSGNTGTNSNINGSANGAGGANGTGSTGGMGSTGGTTGSTGGM